MRNYQKQNIKTKKKNTSPQSTSTATKKKKNHKTYHQIKPILYSDIYSQPQIIPSANDAFSESLPTIDALYSPTFPLEEVRDFVMEALLEAVEVNQVHNRDPIGWSNENLFL